jgi:hypothetical protein
MKSLPIIILIVLSGILFSCKSSNSTGSLPEETGIIMPLAASNIWVYNKIEYASDGSIKRESTDSVKILNDTKLNFSTGIIWYDYNSVLLLANISDPNYPGLWRVSQDLIYPQLWFKYPANVGESFRWGPLTQTLATPTAQKPDSVINLTANSINFVVAAKNVTVTAGDGVTYTCYKYESDYNDAKNITYMQTFDYLAPNAGEIMIENYVRDASNTLKLVSRENLITKMISQ